VSRLPTCFRSNGNYRIDKLPAELGDAVPSANQVERLQAQIER
jgi:hypothetical protein